MNINLLTALLSSDQVVMPEDNQQYKIVGLPPLPVAYVTTIEELAEVLKLAHRERWSLIPVGGGTKLALGNLPTNAQLMVSTQRLNRILTHQAPDLTVSLEAGCTLAQLQTTIGQVGQYLPLDAPYAHQATLGGIVATNSYGTWRYATGRVRDWLIGIKVVSATGEITKAGGQVVKNVAGYDLMKLYTGSLGTLAVIASLNFKLRPRPSHEATVIAFIPSQHWAAASAVLVQSPLTPTAANLVTAKALNLCYPALNATADALLVRFMASAEAVADQCQRLTQLWQPYTREITVIKESSADIWLPINDLVNHYPYDLVLRASILPAQNVRLITEIQAEMNRLGGEYDLISYLGNGITLIYSRLATNSAADYQAWIQAIRSLRDYCQQGQGSLVIEQAPLEIKQQLDSWGESTGLSLMATIKRKFDEYNLLNPGRFVKGI